MWLSAGHRLFNCRLLKEQSHEKVLAVSRTTLSIKRASSEEVEPLWDIYETQYARLWCGIIASPVVSQWCRDCLSSTGCNGMGWDAGCQGIAYAYQQYHGSPLPSRHYPEDGPGIYLEETPRRLKILQVLVRTSCTDTIRVYIQHVL